MPKLTETSVIRDAGKITVFVAIEFDEKEFSADEAEQFVKSAFSEALSKEAALSIVKIDDTQAEVNRMLGVSPETFNRYNR